MLPNYTLSCIERKSFGAWLKVLRERQNLSQQKLAEALGCNRIHVWRLENGRRYPSRILLHSLERIFPAIEDKRILNAFAQMVEYDCDEIYLE
jgi:transcriptional regulator with XRE-family HTH domain